MRIWNKLKLCILAHEATIKNAKGKDRDYVISESRRILLEKIERITK